MGVKVYSRTSPPVTTAHATVTLSTKRLDTSRSWPGLGMAPSLWGQKTLRYAEEGGREEGKKGKRQGRVERQDRMREERKKKEKEGRKNVNKNNKSYTTCILFSFYQIYDNFPFPSSSIIIPHDCHSFAGYWGIGLLVGHCGEVDVINHLQLSLLGDCAPVDI